MTNITFPLLIFSGSNDRAVITFCRYATNQNIEFYIVSNGENDLIYHSTYTNHIIASRPKNILNIEDIVDYVKIAKYKSKQNQLVILPSTEYLNRFLLEHVSLLNAQHVFIGLCTKEAYTIISDKYSFGKLCQKAKLRVPLEYNSKPDFFPFVMKPKTYGLNLQKIHDKPALLYTELQYKNYIQNKQLSDYYYQEYIDGNSYYLLYYISKHKTYTVYVQENLIQEKNGGSIILAKSTDLNCHQIADKYANLLIQNNFHGIIMIEVMERDGIFYTIEANPRFWGPSQLILDADMSLFDLFSFENNLINSLPKRIYQENKWYFWSGGMVKGSTDIESIKRHNFNLDLFLANYADILNAEVYLRNDTTNIYVKETRQYGKHSH
jgi:hypothetical protein